MRSVPTPVSTSLRFAAIDAGARHTCATTTAGEAWCWGNNESGQLGDGNTVSRFFPVQVAAAQAYTLISAGSAHSCALDAGGKAYCWGRNTEGALGDSSLTNRPVPVAVRTPLTFTTVSTGWEVTCGVGADQRGYCWGMNLGSALGDGRSCDSRAPAYPCDQRRRSYPDSIAGGNRVTTISSGGGHSCAVRLDGTVLCWGNNQSFELGIGRESMDEEIPLPVKSTLAFTSVVAASLHEWAGAVLGLGRRIWRSWRGRERWQQPRARSGYHARPDSLRTWRLAPPYPSSVWRPRPRLDFALRERWPRG